MKASPNGNGHGPALVHVQIEDMRQHQPREFRFLCEIVDRLHDPTVARAVEDAEAIRKVSDASGVTLQHLQDMLATIGVARSLRSR